MFRNAFQQTQGRNAQKELKKTTTKKNSQTNKNKEQPNKSV